jgi:hypothetical protein
VLQPNVKAGPPLLAVPPASAAAPNWAVGPSLWLGWSRDFAHRTNTRRRERTTLFSEMIDDILDDRAELTVERHWVVQGKRI